MSIVPLAHVLRQVALAKKELSSYPPTHVNWFDRAHQTCNQLVPWLVEISADLCDSVNHIMNSPGDTRHAIDKLFDLVRQHDDFANDSAFFDLTRSIQSALDYETLLLSEAGGQVVSKLIERFLIERSTDRHLESNGASDYPDLFLRTNDYSELPSFKRGKDQIYGAAVKGKANRPVRIPDGLEIKTCRNTFAVDCHQAHAGLHLVLLFEKKATGFTTIDLQIGYMRRELYRMTTPASPTTTLKASFNGEHFISLLDPRSEAV
ncbi:MAG: hypothetical protein O3C40_24085 [Planctomycetota bacterium]|nr:hypothetical protein [Planctomycetota bacterium]